jgi:hypothetical protein
LDGECAECRKKRLSLQSHSENHTEQSTAAPIEHSALRLLNQPPDLVTHAFQKPRLGHDFSQMNVFAARRDSTRPVLVTTSLFPTDGGPETLDARPMDTMTADGEKALPANGCSVTGSWSSIPSGNIAATLAGSKLGASFSMIGEFTPSIPCNCLCGEYRQYVRGTFTRNGATVTHPLCGANLDPTTYQEDCARIGGTDYKYGYRSIPFATSRFTNPDQATGCRFEGLDAPGITGSSSDTLGVELLCWQTDRQL